MSRLDPLPKLKTQQVEAGLKAVIKDGVASQTMLTLTAGVFLIAFALKLGASNVMIGLLAAIPPLTNLVQIPAILLVEKVRMRKKIAVYAAVSSRSFLLFIGIIPFVWSANKALAFLLIGLLLHTILNSILVCCWNSWMRDLIPQNQLGSFVSKRLSFATIPAIFLTLAAGMFIDAWTKQFPDQAIFSYSALFILGFVAGIVGAYIISTIPEPEMIEPTDRINLMELILLPFKDINYRKLLMFLGSWNFALNLAGPFFAVYLIKRLELGMAFVAGFTIISQLSYLTFLRIWGRLTDKFSNKSVLTVSGTMNIFCILGWTFTTMPERYVLTIPLLIVIHIFMGIATAGVALASGNIGLKLAPRGKATSYLAAASIVNSVAAGVAPVLGGTFAEFFTRREFNWTIHWFSPGEELTIQTLNFRGLDFFFFFAFLIGLYSIHRLAAVHESGEVSKEIVINEFLSLATSRIRNLSTIGGLRYLGQMPLVLGQKIKKKAAKNRKLKSDSP
ncbi:MAG: MFS transporter [bacterium]|nr:MFS transporter [bacterium]